MIRPKRYLMKVRGFELQFGDRTLLMGVLNVTPDSFSDGGKYDDPDRAVERALEMEAQGADIIDIGAESTRPGAKPVSEGEELRRLIPVLKKLEGKLNIPISVDTYKSAVAENALEYGVAFINDPSNGTIDSRLASVVAQKDAGLILNHMRGTPETWSKLGTLPHAAETVLAELETSVNRAQKARVDRGRLIIDPGLGFGKRGDQNYEILSRLDLLRVLDMPIMAGPSRKAFLGQKNNDALLQDFATAAAVTGAILRGAHMVRVHNLQAMSAVVSAADSFLRNSPEEVRDFRDKKRGARSGYEGGGREEKEHRSIGDRFPRQNRFEEQPPQNTYAEAPAPKPYGDRTRTDRPQGGPPRQDREDRFGGRPGGDRPRFDQPRGERPSYDRPGGDRGERGDRPSYDRPKFDGPKFGGSKFGGPKFGGSKVGGPPKFGGSKFGGPPKFGGSKFSGPPKFDRPKFDKPFDRPRGDRPGGDRPSFDRPQFDRPRGDRPGGDRPPFDRPRGGGDRPGGDRPPFDRPRGDRPGGNRPFIPRGPRGPRR